MYFPASFGYDISNNKGSTEIEINHILKYGCRNRYRKVNVLQKKCIMYTCNLNKNHWRLYVVMNPGNIIDSYKYHGLEWNNDETNNEYIQDCKDESRTRNCGIKLTKHDFASK